MNQKFLQVKDQMKNINKINTIVGGVLATGLIAVAFYKLFYQKNKQFNQTKPSQEQQASFQQTYKSVIKSIQQVIKRQPYLSGEVIKCILKNQYKLAQHEYPQFMIKTRKQRRNCIKNKDEYRENIIANDEAYEQLMQMNMNAILAHFKIEKTNWIETTQIWSGESQENKEEWQNILMELENTQLDSLRDQKKKPMSLSKLMQIMDFKIYSLNHLKQSGLDLDSSRSVSQDDADLIVKYQLIDKYIEDLVFQKFNAQVEDINFSQSNLSQEDRQKFVDKFNEFTQMMRVQIYGDDSLDQESKKEQAEDEKQQEQQGQKQVQHLFENEDDSQYY